MPESLNLTHLGGPAVVGLPQSMLSAGLCCGSSFSLHAPAPLGLVRPVVTGIAVLFGIVRLNRAVCVNHRYRFTTWWLGRIVAGLLLMGVVLKLMMPG